MREGLYEEIPQLKRQWVGEKVTCDLCGVEEESAPDYLYIWDVKIGVATEGCAPTNITRDVCEVCYETLRPLIDGLCAALRAGDPELTEAHEDHWYG